MMPRRLQVLLLACWINFNLSAEPLKLEIEGKSAILMNAKTGHVLFEKDSHTLYYPASTTKVATALYALKIGKDKLDAKVTAEADALVTITPEAKVKANFQTPSYWLETDGGHIGIKKGEELSLKDLLYGTLIPSGNDAPNVIAHFLGKGSIPQFMVQLNQFVKELGCQQTHFCNPHGLHHPDHQTTAYDLALITKEALKDPLFREIVGSTRFIRPQTNKQKPVTLLQTNRLLRPGKLYYAKAIGVKTGHHSRAKHNFIGAAEHEGRTLIAVLMHYSDRQLMFQDAIKLFEAAFNQPRIQRQFLTAGEQKFSKVFANAEKPLTTYLKEPLTLDYYPAEDPKPKCLLYWGSLELPISKDQQVGYIELVDGSKNVLKSLPLFAREEVDWTTSHKIFSKIKAFLFHPAFLAVFLLALIGVAFLFAKKRLKT